MVSLNIKPASGYTVKSVTAVTASGKKSTLNSVNGKYMMKMADEDVTITVEYAQEGSSEQTETSAHAINVVSANGGVFVSNAKTSEAIKSAAKGDIVNLMVKPAANYTVESVTATGKNGQSVLVRKSSDNKFVFIMPDDEITVNVDYAQGGSSEQVADGHAINVVSEHGGVFVTKASTSESIKSAAKNEAINFIIKPSTGYTVKNVTAVAKNGQNTMLRNSNGKYVFMMPDSDVTINVEYEQAGSSEQTSNEFKLTEIDFNGKQTVKKVTLDKYTVPTDTVDGYKLVGWKIGNYEMADSPAEALNMIRLAFSLDPHANVTVKPVYEKINSGSQQTVAGYSVTYSEVRDQHYTDYKSGNNVFLFDFDFNNTNCAAFKGAVIEFEFDAPIDSVSYGAYIGNRTITVDPSNPRKVRVEFTTYNPYGDTRAVLSSNMALTPSGSNVSSLHLVGARVLSVIE